MSAPNVPKGLTPSCDLTPLFDAPYYLANNPDVAAAGWDPLLHYLRYGAREGRDPNPFFSTSFYIKNAPTLAASGMDPLTHYIVRGAKEGLNPSPLFDTAYYVAAYPDVTASGMNPLAHYLAYGIKAGRSPRPDSSPEGQRRLSGADGVVYRLEVPGEPRQVKIGEPLIVRGWCFHPSRAITEVVVRWDGGEQKTAFPLAREDIRGSFADQADSLLSGFETWVTFAKPGTPRVELQARFESSDTVRLATLPEVEVVDDRFAEPMVGHFPTPRSFGVLFVDGVGRLFVSRRYRIDNVREALGLVGIRSGETTVVELFENPSKLQSWDLLVLFRTGWDFRMEAVVGHARAWNIPVIFDIDDYAFEPRIASPEHIDGIRDWPPGKLEEYRYGVRAYRRSLVESDYFTGSTDYLVERARDLGKKAYLINNSTNHRLLEVSRALRRARDRTEVGSANIEIVYLSGTRTHQRDFGTVIPALVRVLELRPAVRVRVAGYLDLDEYEALAPFRERITRLDFVPWEQIPTLVAGAEITIAPLEVGNPFCEAKSELKWFEGSVHGLATVASGTRPFERAIVDGQTGFVCRTQEEWTDRLLHLVDHAEERRRLARNGSVHSLNRYAPVHTGRQVLRVYREIVEDKRRLLGVDDDALVVNWLCPDPAAGSGGHNDIFLAANEMVKRHHKVTVYFPGKRENSAKALGEAIRRSFGYQPLFAIGIGFHNAGHCDALIATHHETAHAVQALRDRAFLPAYFVQDYEPYFSAVGTEYFSAEQTYRYNLFCITLGPWLKEVLEGRFGSMARDISFWVDRRSYFPPPARHRSPPRQVVFLARPLMPRRCYELGVASLRELSRRLPEVDIGLFGANDFPGLDFPHRALGILSPWQLGRLYRRADVGLAFSTTNPSLVTFEMMACGLPVVDLDVMESRRRHSAYPAYLAEPSPEGVAEALTRLLTDEDLRSRLSLMGVEFTAPLPSAQDALKQVSVILEEAIGVRPRA